MLALWGLLAASAAFGMNAESFPACRDCNVILVSLDTLRADALAALGASRAATPNLDALARRGILFTNAYSQAPSTFPSHMTLFTGRYPWRHRMNVPKRDRLDAATPTIASLLRARGYRTFWFGPLHDDHLDLKAGFGKGFDTLERPGDAPFSAAKEWLREGPKTPFFAFLHSYHVHDPYTPKRESVRKLDPGADADRYPSQEDLQRYFKADVLSDPSLIFKPGFIASHPKVFAARPLEWSALKPLLEEPANLHATPYHLMRWHFWNTFKDQRPKDIGYIRLLYDALALELDAGVAGLMDALAASGLSEKTIVVFTADHGEEFLEHGQTRHLQLYEECVHVPLLILYPGAAGGRVTQIVQNADVLPTVLEAVGAKPLAGLDGTSLLSAIAGGTLPEPRRAVAYWDPSFSVRDSSFTYIARIAAGGAVAKEELYDRAKDPGEHDDIAQGHASEVEARRRLIPPGLDALRKSKAAWDAGVAPDAKEQLRKTGYW